MKRIRLHVGIHLFVEMVLYGPDIIELKLINNLNYCTIKFHTHLKNDRISTVYISGNVEQML